MYLYTVAVVRSGGTIELNGFSSTLKFHQLVVFCSLKS
jgi:hypothetical protein